jgi:photosystem II oxygen-evolving enhancer protein 1
MRFRSLIIAFIVLCLGVLPACSDAAVNATTTENLTYDQVRNTGLANNCPQLSETARGFITLDEDKSYQIRDFCVQPTEFFVLEEPSNKRREAEYVPSKILTRLTSTLDQISGTLKVDEDGELEFIEEDGIDFQAITVQLPGGEQVPFLFTVKDLEAKAQTGSVINTSTDFEGEFYVPSYRGNVFLDPKGRGIASGYDNAVALPSAADAEDLTRANVKQYDTGRGEISLRVAKVDAETGEIAGVFVSEQPSDTDLGAREPEELKIEGIFYGRIEEQV